MSFAGDGGEAGRVVRASVPPGQVASVIRSRSVERRSEVGPIPFVRRRTFAGGLRSESGARGRSRKSASSPCLRHRSARDRASAHFKSPSTGSSLGLLRPRPSVAVSPRSGVRVSHLPWGTALAACPGGRSKLGSHQFTAPQPRRRAGGRFGRTLLWLRCSRGRGHIPPQGRGVRVFTVEHRPSSAAT